MLMFTTAKKINEEWHCTKYLLMHMAFIVCTIKSIDPILCVDKQEGIPTKETEAQN